MPQYSNASIRNSLPSNSMSVAESLSYETVAASQTKQVLGGVGAIGDTLERLVIIPAVAAAGAVTIFDGATAVLSFVGGGTTALPSVQPITVDLGIKSQTGAWSVTTGANVSVIGLGSFT